MAANKATVSISASLLPDDVKTSVGGTITYDLNDVGDSNKWFYTANSVSTSDQSIAIDGTSFIPGAAGEDAVTVLDAGTDDEREVIQLTEKKFNASTGEALSDSVMEVELSDYENNKISLESEKARIEVDIAELAKIITDIKAL